MEDIPQSESTVVFKEKKKKGNRYLVLAVITSKAVNI